MDWKTIHDAAKSYPAEHSRKKVSMEANKVVDESSNPAASILWAELDKGHDTGTSACTLNGTAILKDSWSS